MLKVFAVRDVKADAFGNLICVPTKGLAVRAFADACADARSPLAQYPEDHSLYEVAEYDPNSGTIKGHPLPVLVVSATEVIAQAKKPAQEVVS